MYLKNSVVCCCLGKDLQGREKAPFQELEEWIGFVQKKLFMLILCLTVYVRENNQIHKLLLSFVDKKKQVHINIRFNRGNLWHEEEEEEGFLISMGGH